MQQSVNSKLKQDHKEYLEKLKNDYEVIFKTESGKRVLEDIARSGFVNRTSFTENELRNAFSEGKRTLALHIIDMATPQPEFKKENAIK